jgi:hypothetical protein
MKLTKDNKTLFQSLSELFVNKLGHEVTKKAYGRNTILIADRDNDGEISIINLYLYKHNILTLRANENTVTLDTCGWFTKTTMARLNSVLKKVGLRLQTKDGDWAVIDNAGQAAQFRNRATIDLTRPHGSAIYIQAD